jgi:hypothetical protein
VLVAEVGAAVPTVAATGASMKDCGGGCVSTLVAGAAGIVEPKPPVVVVVGGIGRESVLVGALELPKKSSGCSRAVSASARAEPRRGAAEGLRFFAPCSPPDTAAPADVLVVDMAQTGTCVCDDDDGGGGGGGTSCDLSLAKSLAGC